MVNGEGSNVTRRTVLRSAGIALATGVGSVAVTGSAAAAVSIRGLRSGAGVARSGERSPGWENRDRSGDYQLIDQGYAGIVREVDSSNSTVRVDWHHYDYDWWMWVGFLREIDPPQYREPPCT